MYSNTGSKAPSLSSLDSDNERPGPSNVDIDRDNNDPNLENFNDTNYKITSNHPWGNILLKIVQDQVYLARKTNAKSMTTNIDELCTSFSTCLITERANTTNKFDKTVATVEKALIDKELNSHTINVNVEPPQKFSDVPVITSATNFLR